jgi:hypothetical protein
VIPIAPPKALIAAAWLAAGGSAFAQSLLNGAVIDAAGPVSIDIRQTGPARIGTEIAPITLSSSGSGSLALTVVQVGSYGATGGASEIRVYANGASASQVTLRQETDAVRHGAVSDVWARILLGNQARGTGQDVTLLQQGSGAQATLVVDSGNHATVHWTQSASDTGSVHSTDGDYLSAYLVQQGTTGNGSSLNIANSGSNNAYGTSGSPIALGALSSLTLTNVGSDNAFGVSLASASTATITNLGSNNTYGIATQQGGDALTLSTTGSGNAFTFGFDGYKTLSWTPGASYPVNGGAFGVQKVGETYAVYDANGVANNGVNATAVANNVSVIAR